ncbi:hypothetical protein [Adhaeretor mobilis]|uniref:hypothetical protein n=1 Tax=Adhaeretor mobilis TaxID=1930276 RepID=UPI001C54D1DE|nr:hypothetical protein [Adhaeretor mobilis]
MGDWSHADLENNVRRSQREHSRASRYLQGAFGDSEMPQTRVAQQRGDGVELAKQD